MLTAVLLFVTNLIFVDCGLSSQDKDTCLNVANRLRALHQGTNPLSWDDTLAAGAQQWAEHLAQSGTFEHAANLNELNLGENIYKLTSSLRSGKCSDAESSWYNEYDNYDYTTKQSTNNKAIGHFTQTVWKGTQFIGVGLATSQAGDSTVTYIVARYSPAGNTVLAGLRDSIYDENVADRKAGAKTPTKYELDPSLCADYHAQCPLLKDYYTCATKSVELSCPKLCNVC